MDCVNQAVYYFLAKSYRRYLWERSIEHPGAAERYPRVRSENAYCAAREEVDIALTSSSNFSVESGNRISGVDRVGRILWQLT